MKKILLSCALILSSTLAIAQIGSAVANVNVIIADVSSITINNGTTVNIDVNTPNHIINGNQAIITNHLAVTSSRPYHVTAKASQHLTFNGQTIDIGFLHLQLQNSTSGTPSLTPPTVINDYPLALTDGVNIISATVGDPQRMFDVTYDLDGGNHLIKPVGTYTTLITYTLIQD